MPNWPLSGRVQDYLRNRAIALSQHKLDYAQDAFPLTTSQIQFSIMEESKVNTLRRYIDEGVQTIEKHRQLRMVLLREALPELPRSVVLRVVLPEWVVVDRATHYGVTSTKYAANESQYLVPDFSSEERLSPDDRHRLISWVERAVRQRRLHALIVTAVQTIVPEHVPTIAHLQQLWPMMCTFMNNDPAALNPRDRSDREFYKLWQDRFRAPVRPMKRYAPDPAIKAKYTKLIKAADTMFAAGMLLAPYAANPKVVNANIEHWEPRDGDFTI